MTPSERRLHPLSFLFAIGSTLRSFLIPILLLLFAARSSTWDTWLFIFIIPPLLVSLVRYLTYRYRFGPDEMVIRTGFIFRNERHIPYQRIHNVGSVQNLFHRLLGVVEVRVETAGGQEPEARIQVLSSEAMEEMRRVVLEQKRRLREAGRAGAGSPAAAGSEPAGTMPEGRPAEGEEAPGKEDSRVLVRHSLGELAVHGIVDNRGMVVMAALFGLAWELGFMGDGWTPDTSLVSNFWNSAGEFVSFLGAVGLVLAVAVVFIVALRVFSIGWTILKLYDFTLTRTGQDLVTQCGLFTRVTTSIPTRRIQMVTVQESVLQRLFGRVTVRVVSAGGAQEEEATSAGRRLLAPSLPGEQLVPLLREILPELNLEAITWSRVDPRARRRILRVTLVFGLLVTIALLPIIELRALVLPLVWVPFAWVNARRQVEHMGYAAGEDLVLFRSGWLRRKMSVARTSKIQTVAIAESPFDRRYGMALLKVDTAGAGQATHHIHIPFLIREEADRLLGLLAGRAASTAFRW